MRTWHLPLGGMRLSIHLLADKVRFARPRKIIASSVACSAFLLYLLLTAGIAANLGPFPNFEDLRSHWRPSYAYLLDRHGEVLHELRVDYSVQRLPWTPLTALRHQLLGLDGHNVRDAAALVVDNRTGAVLAY